MHSHSKSYKFPVSVKGIVTCGDKVLLLKNERDEWELPGGKLEITEIPEECVVREIKEEVNLEVSVQEIVDVWVYTVFTDVHVLIVTYGCKAIADCAITISHEHRAAGWFELREIPELPMPTGYKQSIHKWFATNALKSAAMNHQ